MKKSLLTLLACFACYNSNAEQFTETGTINRLGSIDSRTDADFIILNGFTSAGSCTLSSGLVVARFYSGDLGARSFSIALAAKMSNQPVTLAINDTVKNTNGHCYVQSIALSD